LPWIGAEIEYVDLGRPGTTLAGAASGVPAAAKASGPALFGLAYLPLTLFDVYGKVGVSRVRTSADATAVGIVGVDICYFQPALLGCQSFHDSRQATGIAWGGGVQLKLSSFGLRAEYERFGSGSARPSLASIIVSWRF
jgi:opacity protein-like surface antigen